MDNLLGEPFSQHSQLVFDSYEKEDGPRSMTYIRIVIKDGTGDVIKISLGKQDRKLSDFTLDISSR